MSKWYWLKKNSKNANTQSSNTTAIKALHELLTTETIDSEEKFLKEFSKDFYQKIIYINDFNTIKTFENNLNEWIKSININAKEILSLMRNHEKKQLFSSIIGFFYQHGIGCNVDKNKALELYLLCKIKKESLEVINDDELFDILQNINIVIGKYLLSLFYYKDIILDQINLSNFNKYLKSAIKGDSIAQYNLGCCYQYGQGTAQDYNKALEWYSKSANNGCAEGQNNLGECYYYGRGTTKDYIRACIWYSKAANAGYALGRNNFGECYHHGRGVKKNHDK